MTKKYRFELVCANISMAEIQKTFSSTAAAHFDTIFLLPSPKQPDFFIPKDMFLNRCIKISLSVSGAYCFPQKCYLDIHPEAFRSSRNTTRIITIQSLDLGKLDFSFLQHFQALQEINIFDSFNLSVFNLPQLPRLSSIIINNCTGLNYWTNFPHLVNGLVNIFLKDNMLSDERVENILKKIQMGPSMETLVFLDLRGNALTRIPRQLRHFSKILEINLKNQHKPGFRSLTSPILFDSAILSLDLSSCYITEIQPHTFQGRKKLNYIQILYEIIN